MKWAQDNQLLIQALATHEKRHKQKTMTAYIRKRLRSDPAYKTLMLLRARSKAALKAVGAKKAGKTVALLGCSIAEFRQHLQSQFQPGMTWENQGEWELDHIKPCAAHDLTSPQQQAECFHYTNLQPLWRAENRSKSDIWEGKRHRRTKAMKE